MAVLSFPAFAQDVGQEAVAQADIADRVVVTGMVPVPEVGEGAPYFSPAELELVMRESRRVALESEIDARKCQTSVIPEYASARRPTLEVVYREEATLSRRVAALSQRSAEATRLAEESRAGAARGAVDMKAVEAAELVRQEAVNDLQKMQNKLMLARNATADLQDLVRYSDPLDITWGALDARASQRRRADAADKHEEFAGLALDEVVAHELEGKKGPYLRITGVIRNQRGAFAPIPGLHAAAVDERGFVLTSQRVEAGRGARLRAGESKAFTMDLTPSPEEAYSVVVVFASKFAVPPRLSANSFDACNGAAELEQE